MYNNLRSRVKGELTEKSIIQSNSINALHIRIPQKFRINVEEHGHIHRLAFIQSLLLETETLYLAEVRRYLRGCDAVRCNTYYIFLFTLIRSCIEC